MFILGVKEWNEIDGHFLQVTNYCDYLEDVASSSLSDEDFTQVVNQVTVSSRLLFSTCKKPLFPSCVFENWQWPSY